MNDISNECPGLNLNVDKSVLDVLANNALNTVCFMRDNRCAIKDRARYET